MTHMSKNMILDIDNLLQLHCKRISETKSFSCFLCKQLFKTSGGWQSERLHFIVHHLQINEGE